MNKDTKIYLLLVAIVLLIIIGIFIKQSWNNEKLTADSAACISKKAALIASETCGHCQEQKKTLGEYLKNFTILSVDEDPSLWAKYSLVGVPTWIINEKTYPGTKTIKELKDLTNC